MKSATISNPFLVELSSFDLTVVMEADAFYTKNTLGAGCEWCNITVR